MIIVDTSIWIDVLRNRGDLIDTVQTLLKLRELIGLEPVFTELLQGAKYKKEIKEIIELWIRLEKITEQNHWLRAGLLSYQNKWKDKGIGIVDSFIIATAWKYNYKIWTLDKKLSQIAGKDFTYQAN